MTTRRCLSHFSACAILALGSLTAEATATTTTSASYPSTDCPCINSTQELVSNCERLDGTRGFFLSAAGDSGSNGNLCYPLSYGSDRCATHDLDADPLCQQDDGDGDDDRPAYCHDAWCFVAYDQCRKSTESLYASSSIVTPRRLYYSYSTCGSTAADWLDFSTTRPLRNTTLRIALPQVDWPHHWKRRITVNGGPADREGPEYYNDQLPWEGWAVEYFDAVLALSNVIPHKVQYTHRSRGSQTKGYYSAWTQTVTDVGAGIVDMSVSSYWVTSERLAITPFTVPVMLDSFKLMIPQPELDDGKFGENARKVLLPFSTELWLLTIGTILVYASLSLYLSPSQFFRPQDKDGAGSRSTTLQSKVRRVMDALLGSASVGFVEFMGAGVDHSMEANTPQRFVNFGFAFFVFISVTAYTANLAAFLTISGAQQYLSSVDDAVAQNVPICADAVVRNELQDLYPNAKWIFEVDYERIAHNFDNGQCGAIVLGWVDIRGDASLQQLWCDRNLVRVGHTIMEKPVGFPADRDIVGGISHWITVANDNGITYEDFLTKNEAVCDLEIRLSDQGSDNLEELMPVNLVLPLFVFALCSLLGVACYWWELVSSNRKDAPRAAHRSFTRDADEATSRVDQDLRMVDVPEQPPVTLDDADDQFLFESVDITMKELHILKPALLARTKNGQDK